MRPALREARDVSGMIAPRLLGTRTDLDGDAFRPHALVPLPGHTRIWIFQRRDDARDARTDNGIGAGRCLAVMRTGLKRHIHRGALRQFSCAPERLDFRMRAAAVLGPAPANDDAVFRDPGADRRIGPGAAEIAAAERERKTHIALIS